MGDKYNRQVRKAVNSLYKEAFDEVLMHIVAKAHSASFFQRLKIATGFVFKKQFKDFIF